jgi:hypothetical protein
LGAVVSSSRGVLFPFQPDDATWERRIEEAAQATVAALRNPMSRASEPRP